MLVPFMAEVSSAGDDHADEAPARISVAAIRVEAIRLAAGAPRDVFDGDAERFELRADGGAQIDEGLLAFAPDDESIADARRDVGADFEAARSDARTDRGDDRSRVESLDGDLEDPRFDASPSRVHGGDLSAVGRGEKDRNAVGDADCDRVTFARAGDAVGLDLQEGGGIAVRIGRIHDGPPVDLLRLEEAAVVEADVFRERFLKTAERNGVTQGGEIAGTARGEGVTESGFFQRISEEQQRSELSSVVVSP